MIRKLIKYPIAHLMAIVVIYTVYDYFEHIGRKGSTFEAHPWYWLLFSIAAILSLNLIVLLVKKIFPDLCVKIEVIIAENDLIAVRLTFIATHKDVFLGIEATDKNITWEAMEFFRLKDGKKW